MINEKKMYSIIVECYKELYKNSEPKADIYKLIKLKETLKDGWFEKYHLSMDKQIEIVDEVCKKNKCTKYEKQAIRQNVFLGGSPCSCNYRRKDHEKFK